MPNADPLNLYRPGLRDTLTITAASTWAESTQITDVRLSEIIVQSKVCFSNLP